MEREYNPTPLTGETKQDLENQPIVPTQSLVALIQPYEKPKFERQTTMNFPEKIWEMIKPKFRDSTELSPEQLTDPDYRLKQIEKLNRDKFSMIRWSCSRCHHCR